MARAIAADPSELSYTVIAHTHRTPGESGGASGGGSSRGGTFTGGASSGASGGTSSGGAYGTAAWTAGTRAKVAWVNSVTARYTTDTVYLVTDLDVMPLRPLDALVRWFVRQRTVEVAFMREPGRTTGMHGVQWALNTGFFLLRNTWQVRTFIAHWKARIHMNKHMLEQDLANWLLVSPHAAHTQLNWTLIPDELATANLSRVGPRTVAFHAVGVTGEAKFKRLWQGYKLAGPEGRLSLERQHCNGAGGRVGGRVGGSSRGMFARP